MNTDEIRELAENIYDPQSVTPFEYYTVDRYVEDLMGLAWDQGWTADLSADDIASLRAEFARMAHADLDNTKRLVVCGKDGRFVCVDLIGTPTSEVLRPATARRAKRAAGFAKQQTVTVWSLHDGYGYRVYAESARKLHTNLDR